MPLASFLARHRKHVLLENDSFRDERLDHVPSKKPKTVTRRRRVASTTNKFFTKAKRKSAIMAKNISIVGRRIYAWKDRRPQKKSKTVDEQSIRRQASSFSKKSIGGKNNEEKIVIQGMDSLESSTSACCSQSSTPLNSIVIVEPSIGTLQDAMEQRTSQQATSEVESLGDNTGWNSDDMDGFNAQQYIAEPPIFFDEPETQTLDGGTVISRVISVVDSITNHARIGIADITRGKVCISSRDEDGTSSLSEGTKDSSIKKDNCDAQHYSACHLFPGSDYFLGNQCSFQGRQSPPVTSLADNDVILSSTTWYQGMVEVVLGKQKTCSHCLETVSEKEAVVRVYPYEDTDVQQHFFHESCNEERRKLVMQKDLMLKEFEGFCSLLRAHKKHKNTIAKTLEGARRMMIFGHEPSKFELAGMKHFASKFSFMRVGRGK